MVVYAGPAPRPGATSSRAAGQCSSAFSIRQRTPGSSPTHGTRSPRRDSCFARMQEHQRLQSRPPIDRPTGRGQCHATTTRPKHEREVTPRRRTPRTPTDRPASVHRSYGQRCSPSAAPEPWCERARRVAARCASAIASSKVSAAPRGRRPPRRLPRAACERVEVRGLEPFLYGGLGLAVAMRGRGAGKPRGALEFVVDRRDRGEAGEGSDAAGGRRARG